MSGEKWKEKFYIHSLGKLSDFKNNDHGHFWVFKPRFNEWAAEKKHFKVYH